MRFTRIAAALVCLGAATAPRLAFSLSLYDFGAAADTTRVPPVIRSENGVLNVSLGITPDTVTISGTQYTRNLYGIVVPLVGESPIVIPGRYLPPTLRLNPGDSLNITVTNQMSTTADTSYHGTTTNFHFHGFNVTPGRGSETANVGDQVVSVAYDSGTTHTYAFRLPPDHPSGMHWYHPHPHGFTDEQVAGGMSGAIIVGDIRARTSDPTMPEKVLLLKDFQPQGPNGAAPAVLNINGDIVASFTIPVGTRQLWHIGNVGADNDAGLALVNVANPADTLRFIVLAMDGNGLITPDTVASLRLPLAVRYDVVVEAPDSRATYQLINTGGNNFAQNGAAGSVLGTLAVTGPTRAPLVIAPDPNAQARVSAVQNATVSKTKYTFVFSVDQNALPDSQFQINNESYEPRRIDVRVPLGEVQEWTLVNDDTGPHIFHIHQGDFLVMSTNGTAPPSFNSVQDRLSLEPGDTVVVRIPFTENFQTGLYVFHCHILFHEDHGMMKNICVYPPSQSGDGGKKWCESQLPSVGHSH